MSRRAARLSEQRMRDIQVKEKGRITLILEHLHHRTSQHQSLLQINEVGVPTHDHVNKIGLMP